jgi:putative acetyltransferase
MIRAYQDPDLNDLLDVWEQASRLAHPFLDDDFLRFERQAIAELHLPAAETWVFVVEERVVGFIALVGDEVGALFVDPAHHRRGIGRALMDHARAIRRDPLEVEVFEANAIGRRFYVRYGFVPVKERVHEQTGHPLLRLRLPSR